MMELHVDNQRQVESSVLKTVVDILEDMTRDWDTGHSGHIGGQTWLMEDLGFTSIDLVALIAAIDGRWHRRDWPYERLLMVEDRYVDDVRVADFVDFLVRNGAS